MPIPPFDNILNALPPHLGDPTLPTHLSPYPCTVQELVDRFATSPQRKLILEGFLNLRGELFRLGLNGFQWLDGSFLEDIEALEGRAPNDIDVVTFIEQPATQQDLLKLILTNPTIMQRGVLKATYSVDHFLVPLCSKARSIVYQSRYWYGLFSHRRGGLWKGMLAVELTDPTDDTTARAILGGKP